MNPIFYFFSEINESEYKFSLWLINIILFWLDPNYLKIKVSENKLFAWPYYEYTESTVTFSKDDNKSA